MKRRTNTAAQAMKSNATRRGSFLVVGGRGGEEGGGGGGAGGGGGSNGDAANGHGEGKTNGHSANEIERWLVDSEAHYTSSRFDSDYIPIERQLPPADFSL